MKVIFLAPIILVRPVARRDATRKMPRATVNCIETSNDLRYLNKAKKGMTKVTRRKPTPRAKKARMARLLRKAVNGT